MFIPFGRLRSLFRDFALWRLRFERVPELPFFNFDFGAETV